ncbi:MAG: aminotransferase class I/II-fold pyridoxal phosphate-dependent enzyme [Pseudomonadota bacterium]
MTATATAQATTAQTASTQTASTQKASTQTASTPAATAHTATAEAPGLTFTKPFTQQEPLSDAAIAAATRVMQGGRLHRYNTLAGETAEASLLERAYADWQGAAYCVATTSGGQAMQLALRAVGVRPGDRVLSNAFTLAPVPGALHAVGAEVVLVEIGRDWLIDLDDLADKAASNGARVLMLSHMRGHIADMEAILAVCDAHGIALIEDCAHTMGARWKGRRSGSFGRIGCFSTQTYKHLNSGEGGFVTTDDADLAARMVIMSGSYMLHDRHGAAPGPAAFERVKLDMPNLSCRMDNLRAAILRAELPMIDGRIARWNALYRAMEAALGGVDGIETRQRPDEEAYVGSSFQFHVTGAAARHIPAIVAACGTRGVDLKWFGADQPHGFTSRYDSWRYLGPQPALPRTLAALSTTIDLRLPLTFQPDDCAVIGRIIAEEVAAHR